MNPNVAQSMADQGTLAGNLLPGLSICNLYTHKKSTFRSTFAWNSELRKRASPVPNPRLNPNADGLRLIDINKHITGPRCGPASLHAKPCRRHNLSSWSPRPCRQHEKQLLKSRRRNSYDNLPASSWGLHRTHRWRPSFRSPDYHLCMAEAPGLVPELDLGRRRNSSDNLSASSWGLPRTHQCWPNVRSSDCHLCMVPVWAHMSAQMSGHMSAPELAPESAWTTR